MAKDIELQRFYNSRQWRKVSKAYLLYRMNICERCGASILTNIKHEVNGKLRTKIEYNIHHKKELTIYNLNDPNISLSFSNLELLCLDCHNKEHERYQKRIERVEFNEKGEIKFND